MTVIVKKAVLGLCECCGLLKKVKLYALQSGQAAWVCKECRKED